MVIWAMRGARRWGGAREAEPVTLCGCQSRKVREGRMIVVSTGRKISIRSPALALLCAADRPCERGTWNEGRYGMGGLRGSRRAFGTVFFSAQGWLDRGQVCWEKRA